jgi:coproporphyrinogen III oxidase-like Fe-S oxidoreductase
MDLSPSPDKVFDTSGGCLQYAQDFAVAHGYAITTKRNKFITVNNTRELQVAYLHCNKSGECRNYSGEENFEREIISRLMLQFGVKKEGLSYTFSVRDRNHNHDPSLASILPHNLMQESQEVVSFI